MLRRREHFLIASCMDNLLSYLASELIKVGSCLTASCKESICNWNERLYVFYNMFKI